MYSDVDDGVSHLSDKDKWFCKINLSRNRIMKESFHSTKVFKTCFVFHSNNYINTPVDVFLPCKFIRTEDVDNAVQRVVSVSRWVIAYRWSTYTRQALSPSWMKNKLRFPVELTRGQIPPNLGTPLIWNAARPYSKVIKPCNYTIL